MKRLLQMVFGVTSQESELTPFPQVDLKQAKKNDFKLVYVAHTKAGAFEVFEILTREGFEPAVIYETPPLASSQRSHIEYRCEIVVPARNEADALQYIAGWEKNCQNRVNQLSAEINKTFLPAIYVALFAGIVTILISDTETAIKVTLGAGFITVLLVTFFYYVRNKK